MARVKSANWCYVSTLGVITVSEKTGKFGGFREYSPPEWAHNEWNTAECVLGQGVGRLG